jgi:hypothetical protein
MADPRPRDEYTKDRFDWIDQVIADPELPASASKVAYAIATSLWRNKGTVTLVTPEITASDNVREAWIGTRHIADKIAMSRFTVMKMVDRLEERGHLEVDRGKRGRGHANHYRLVRKGAHGSLLEGAKAKPRAKSKGAPANLSDGEKVSPHTSRGASTHLNPFVPYEEIPSEEHGAPQARPATDPLDGRSSRNTGSLNITLAAATIDDDDSDVAWGAPPPAIQRHGSALAGSARKPTPARAQLGHSFGSGEARRYPRQMPNAAINSPPAKAMEKKLNRSQQENENG